MENEKVFDDDTEIINLKVGDFKRLLSESLDAQTEKIKQITFGYYSQTVQKIDKIQSCDVRDSVAGSHSANITKAAKLLYYCIINLEEESCVMFSELRERASKVRPVGMKDKDWSVIRTLSRDDFLEIAEIFRERGLGGLRERTRENNENDKMRSLVIYVKKYIIVDGIKKIPFVEDWKD